MKYVIILSLLGSVVFSGCVFQDGERELEYAPNMYHSIPLEPYSQVVDDYAAEWARGPLPQRVLPGNLNAQPAPEGTIPRGDTWPRGEEYEPYGIPNDLEGYETAGATLISPLRDTEYDYNGTEVDCSEDAFLRGKEYYEQYCIMCHGPNGQGKGSLAVKVNKPFEGLVPSYTSAEGTGLRNLSEGKMYHSITYGKGLMGSYASQLTPQQRWEVICYIQHYQRLGQ